MYKVLIVDDERPIREGLVNIIPWEAHGFCVADTATDGFDALAKFDAIRPDLVLADMRMPEMDGLQLLEKIRERDKRVHVLILSGFAEFDYARQAIRQNCDGYLLKPMDEEELIDQLSRIRKSIEEEYSLESLGERTHVRELLIKTLIEGSAPEAAYLENLTKMAALAWNTYQVLLIEFPGGQDLHMLRNLAKQSFGAKDSGAVFDNGSSIGVLLRHAHQKDYTIAQLDAQLQSAFGHNIRFRAALGVPAHSLAEVFASYTSAKHVLARAFFSRSGRIVWSVAAYNPAKPDLPQSRSANGLQPSFAPDEWAEKICFALDSRSEKNVDPLLAACAETVSQSAADETAAKQSYVHLCGHIVDRFVESHPELRAARQEIMSWVLEIYSQNTFAELIAFVRDRVFALARKIEAQSPEALVRGMTNLIEHNYYENLKLENLSAIFNYSSAYLGKLFKQHTGEYFNTYLDKVRVRKAIELLGQGLKVYRVSEMVGYSYVDYFHQKFRKYTGQSPSTYRIAT